MRRAFTLIELLIAIAIIGILAAAILFVMSGAQEQARKARAKSEVIRIYSNIARKFGEYSSRPVPIRIPPGTSGNAAAQMRLNAVRELMRLEFPERREDIDKRNPGYGMNSLLTVPSVARGYQRRIEQATASHNDWTPEYEGAECLWLILAGTRDGDGVALDGFSASEIGDVDQDGMKEILDPWGQPIEWLRWAPALESPLQHPSQPAWVAANPDPLDPFRAFDSNNANYVLLPLIYSVGPDGVAGINRAPGFSYAGTTPPNNPYATIATPPGIGLLFAGSGDNITNHLID